MKNILVDVKVHDEGLRRVEGMDGVQVRTIAPSEEQRALPAGQISDCEILFCSYPPANLADMKALKWVQIASVGYEHLYNTGLAERGIRVCNARGVFDPTIAEWNIAMVINLARDLRGMIRNQEHGIFHSTARYQTEVRGLTVGVWGYGGIGRATAALAKALGMRVHVFTRSGVSSRDEIYAVPGVGDPGGTLPDQVFVAGQELQFLSRLDFLVLALPKTPETVGIIGTVELQALPDTAYLLNPARGPLVDESALLQALREGWIAGAALDTHYQYPMPADHPLWRFPNVIMTPHISGSSSSPHYSARLWDIFAQNTHRYLAGRPLLNELSSQQLAPLSWNDE